MFSSLTLVSLFSLVYPAIASPVTCFDASFNLLAFGFGGKDWNAGTQDSWASGTAQDITTTGRPPFDGTDTTCYLAQFYNAIYIMNGDASNPSSIYIYDAAGKAWSTQQVTTGTFDPTSFNAILDHDTNVFYALSKGEVFFLDMGSLVTANASAVAWVDVEKSPLGDSYDPTFALADNHVYFLDVPGTPAGDANIFVIHFSFFQPDPQSYPLPDGSAIPAAHGKTASFFQPSAVQQEFAYIPDDGSATYVIDVLTNTTQSLPGPSTKDAAASYSASITALVQLDSKGAVTYLPYKQGDASTNAQASWASVAKLASIPTTSNSTGSSGGSTSGNGASGTNSASAGGSSPSGSSASGNSSGAVPMSLPTGVAFVVAGMIGAAAMML